MDNFFEELKRRHIYRVGAAYAVVAWVLLQLVNNIAPALRLPDWALALVIVLLFIGFPIALIFAWIRELKALTNLTGTAVRVTAGKSDWILFGALALVILLILYQQFAPVPGAMTAQQQANAASATSVPKPAGISVAVLPFMNLSSDKEQEFFSDGMTEEITSALAKVSNLRVVGRTSAFQFKGENKDLRAIGLALSATHLIEGSVRKDGNEVRITAQLIKADDGTHLWTESYNRELKGVFAIQEEIATAIANALRVPLGLRPGENLVNNRNIDPDFYQRFLRARALILMAGPVRIAEAVALLEPVVASNPNYVPASLELARAYYGTVLFHPARFSGSPDEFRRVADAYLTKAEAAARHGIELDASSPGGYLALANVLLARGNIPSADEMISTASALDPNNPDVLNLRSAVLAIVGRMKEANAIRQQLRAMEPLAPANNRFTALWLWVEGQDDAAIAILKALPPDANANNSSDLAMLYAWMGNYREAADTLENSNLNNRNGTFTKDAAQVLRTAPAKTAAPMSFPQLGQLGWVYLHVGAPQRALEYYEREAEAGFRGFGFLPLVWHPSYAPVRKTERFKTHVRGLGLVEYWRAKGWPPFCHPTTGDDFECN